MDISLRQQTHFLFEKYNEELGNIYDRILEDVKSEETLASPEFQDYLQNSICNSLQPWYSAPLAGLESGTPEAFFDALLDIDDVMDVFVIAAEKIDGDLPDLLMLRVGAFGETAAARLRDMAVNHDWQPEEGEDIDAFRGRIAAGLAAMRVLGQWNDMPSVKPVMDRFCGLSEPDEFVADAMKEFIVPYSEKILPELLARIDPKKNPGLPGPYEYLLISLTEIGRENRTDEIFRCLKEAFRGMKNKVIASICLGDYGDGRAVPLLKSYLERHISEIDRQFFYETLSAVKRLGGDISDVQDPFRDFSTKK